MQRIVLFLIFSCCLFPLFSQEKETEEVELDSLYREDQFYFAVTYNLLTKKPDGISQSGFSSGFHAGFIRDIPLNKRRNVAIGLGVGLSSNSYNQNMLITKNTSNNYTYSSLNDTENSYTKNKFTTYLVEFPIEFRWRTSTYTEYKFWRIYFGAKIGYVFANSSKYLGSPSDIKNKSISHFNTMQYGLQLSGGYNTWNAYIYYSLNPIFTKKATLNGNAIEMRTLKIGLVFYIL